MLAQLIPANGTERITLTRDITVVGRSSRMCDLVINHSSISKVHCILIKTDGLIYMRDLGSTNGTRVNGQRVIRGALLPGDRLSFSGISFKVHLGPDPRPGEVPPTVGHVPATVPVPVVSPEGGLLKDLGSRPPANTKPATGRRRRKNMSDSDLLPPD